MNAPVASSETLSDGLLEAVREDLELYGVSELEERLDILASEAARVQAQIEKKKSSRAVADAFFGAPSPD